MSFVLDVGQFFSLSQPRVTLGRAMEGEMLVITPQSFSFVELMQTPLGKLYVEPKSWLFHCEGIKKNWGDYTFRLRLPVPESNNKPIRVVQDDLMSNDESFAPAVIVVTAVVSLLHLGLRPSFPSNQGVRCLESVSRQMRVAVEWGIARKPFVQLSRVTNNGVPTLWTASTRMTTE